ncbi:hypothetical protein NMY22_g2318 [Coprinellus aureogranulatus]|nr:hypothetical protein NMY22_g2318 [Coprinellus aureogranulatus]
MGISSQACLRTRCQTESSALGVDLVVVVQAQVQTVQAALQRFKVRGRVVVVDGDDGPISMLIWLLVLNFLSLCVAEEYFDEKLTVIPLKDGKVASTLSFSTILKDVTPRNPERLHEDDECESTTI